MNEWMVQKSGGAGGVNPGFRTVLTTISRAVPMPQLFKSSSLLLLLIHRELNHF